MKLFWFFKKKKLFFQEEYKLFSEDYLEKLKREIISSKYLAKNHLNYNFSTTLGFSLIFKASKIGLMKEKFPFFSEYFDRVFLPEIDVYYLNPLVLNYNSRVERHIDHSLRSYDPEIGFPNRVAVLYVSVPKMKGGELVLYEQERMIKKIKPQNNKLVFFAGELKHEIKNISRIDGNEKQRISLVCEQYKANEEQLKKIPDFLIRSSSSFKNFLEMET